MYDSSTMLILIARLSLFLDGLIQVRCMTFNLQTADSRILLPISNRKQANLTDINVVCSLQMSYTDPSVIVEELL